MIGIEMSPYYEVILRMAFAIFTGCMIGWERKMKGKPVGVITNVLVCLGATMLAIYQQLLYSGIEMHGFSIAPQTLNLSANSGRIVAQIVSGIGFLGAGTIMRDQNTVSGITTAATLWITACLGIVIGSGYWFLSLVSVFSVIFILFFVKNFINTVIDHKRLMSITISCGNSVDIVNLFNEFGLSFSRYKVVKIEKKNGQIIKIIRIKILIPKYINFDKMIQDISQREGIYSVNNTKK